MAQIKRWDTGELIHEFEGTLKEAVEDAVKKKISLAYADLRDANLYRANLYRANLQNANFEGSNPQSAFIKDANLEGVKGLDLFEKAFGYLEI